MPPLGRVDLDASGTAVGTAQVLVDAFIVPVFIDDTTATSTGVSLFHAAIASSIKLMLVSEAGVEISIEAPRRVTAIDMQVPADGHLANRSPAGAPPWKFQHTARSSKRSTGCFLRRTQPTSGAR